MDGSMSPKRLTDFESAVYHAFITAGDTGAQVMFIVAHPGKTPDYTLEVSNNADFHAARTALEGEGHNVVHGIKVGNLQNFCKAWPFGPGTIPSAMHLRRALMRAARTRDAASTDATLRAIADRPPPAMPRMRGYAPGRR